MDVIWQVITIQHQGNKYITPDRIKSHTDIIAYLNNISTASKEREWTLRLLIDDMGERNNVRVVGDFNDVGGSKTIKGIEKCNLKDAWWEGGTGYGATIYHPFPYRIDHIFYSDGIKLEGIMKVDAKGISDHDALYAFFDIVR